MHHVLAEIVPDVGTKGRESAKAMDFAVEALEFEHACVCRMKSGDSGKDCKGPVSSERYEGAEPVIAL